MNEVLRDVTAATALNVKIAEKKTFWSSPAIL